jgi:transcriptional regulator with GAF, ATPase, and Fis domain
MGASMGRSAGSAERIDHRARDLMVLSGRLAAAIDPSEVVAAVLDVVIQLFNLEACSVGLLDDAARRLRLFVSRGRGKTDEFDLTVPHGIAGWVAQHGEGVVCNDVEKDERFFPGVDQRSGFRTRAVMCVPLRHGQRVLGVLEALNPRAPDTFAQRDLSLLEAFATVVAAALERARVVRSLRESNVELRAAAADRYQLVLGPSAAMRSVVELARRAATASTTVLLLGESGTGKEVVARAIHCWSPRADAPFVAVNCTALTPELLESELFGHERGAFTGAVAAKKGRFELADGGTLFLDEIGELAPGLQVKLLRVLQEREFQRVGGVKDIRVDVRIIAATNRDLKAAVRAGSFREDLLYRLNVITIVLPPLRERADDVPVIARHFAERFAREMSRPTPAIGDAVLRALTSYGWPGNVRELQNVIERAVALGTGPAVDLADLPLELQLGDAVEGAAASGDAADATSVSLRAAIDGFTRGHVERALAAAGGRQSEAALLLGLPQSNLSRLMKRLGLR